MRTFSKVLQTHDFVIRYIKELDDLNNLKALGQLVLLHRLLLLIHGSFLLLDAQINVDSGVFRMGSILVLLWPFVAMTRDYI